MRERQTLFESVFQPLEEQILSGRLGVGSRLESINELSARYGVGTRTIREVLQALKEKGYIRTEERKAAVVVYRQAEAGMAARSVLERRTSILQVYRTAGVLEPLLLAFCTRFCSEEELRQTEAEIARLARKNPEQRGRACSACLHALVERSQNPLLSDLFASLEIYTRIPFFRGRERFVELVAEQNGFGPLSWVMEALLTRDTGEIAARFGALFRCITAAAEKYLDEMAQEFGDTPEDPAKAYCWTAERGRDHYYMQITRDLIDKIGMGKYAAGAFLPTEAELAEEYGVCIATVRKALAMLNELGFGQTVPATGTKVTMQGQRAVMRVIKNKTFKQDTLRYLSGLQLMALAIQPAALLAYDAMDGAARRRLGRQLRASEGIPLELLLQCVMEFQPLEPLRTILKETNKLLHWGYYFAFYSEGPASAELLTQKSLDAFDCLQKNDKQGFANTLASCYCHILAFVRGHMMRCGLAEAAKIVTPDMLAVSGQY